MAIFVVKSSAVLRSTFYLKDGGPVPSGGTLYPPLRILMLDSQAYAKPLDSVTTPVLLDSQMRAEVRR